MLLVPRPLPIQRHFGSVSFIASSVRQTPPPAVPTHTVHAPVALQRGEIAIVDTRPDVVIALPAFWSVSGPRLTHGAPCGVLP